MTAHQPTLPNLTVTIRRPLVGTNGASAILDRSTEEVDALIDLGALIAFNIATDTAPGSKRELRFLVESLNYFHTARDPYSFRREWREIFRLILSHDKPMIDGPEIDAALNCNPDHRLNLIRAERLQTCSGAGWRPGRNGAPFVTRESFERFLQARQL
jgi:hypothetical protein